MTFPQPTQEVHLQRLLPMISEMLGYMIAVSVENNTITYDAKRDELLYHSKVTDIDRELFDLLHGVEEIWIITKARTES